MAGTVWSEHGLVAPQVTEAIKKARDGGEFSVRWHVRNWIDKCIPPLESPIEACFSLWWGVCVAVGSPIILKPQHEVTVHTAEGRKHYRLDFAVGMEDPLVALLSESLKMEFKVAIELDGHDFHERTKEQVALRNRRDRDLQADGWKVFHVSGSELVRSPEKVVVEVNSHAAIEFDVLRNRIAKALIGKGLAD